jgi:hypothetical protein
VITPNGGQNWEGNTVQAITWTSTGSIANVSIDYSTDSGSSWNVVAASTTNSGSYSWTVPNSPSTSCLVRVSDTAGPAADVSDGVFTIAEQRTLAVATPNGGQNWEGNTVQTITWTYTGSIPNVSIDYSTDNGSSWNVVTASTANSGSYAWTVPNTPSANCLVRISDISGPAIDVSDGVFSIVEQRTVTVTAPDGGQRWFIGSTYPITWTSTGSIPNVSIEYSTDSGSSWNIIAASVANSGSYNWTVPNTPSANCLVKIGDTAGPASDTSNAVFTIDPFPTIIVTSPNGSESLQTETVHVITWNITGTIANVSIDWSADGGSNWTAITASTPNTGTYNWTVPIIESTNCLVRVSDTVTSATDTSNGVFNIYQPPSITVTSPNGGEAWLRKSTQTITWTTTGNVGLLHIHYSINGGSSWINLANDYPNTGSYIWKLPNVSSDKTECLVKISAVDSSAEDISDAVFTILKQ